MEYIDMMDNIKAEIGQRGPSVTIESQAKVGPSSPSKPDEYGKYFLLALQGIEEKFPVAGALITIVGYVVIAAFGEMDSFWKYIAYLSILIIGFSFFSLQRKKPARYTYTFVIIITILLAYISVLKKWHEPIINLFK